MPMSLSAGGPGNLPLFTDDCGGWGCSEAPVVEFEGVGAGLEAEVAATTSFGGDERRKDSAEATIVSSSLRLKLSLTKSQRHLAEREN